MGPAPAVAEVRAAVRAVLADRTARPDHSTRSERAAGTERAAGMEAARRRSATGRVLVACSGGADSLALAAATAFEAPRAGIEAGLVTVDHGLSEGSAEQAARVAEIGHELGFDPVEIVSVDVGAAGGPEAAARTARYAALRALAEALDAYVLLAHTLDDQAETVLLGLGRGSGPRSIAGMATRDGRWLRPFLGVRRHTTEAACAALGLEPWRDPQNSDPAYQRVRLRHEVLPLLEDVLQGGVAEALARTAHLLRDDVEALDAWANSVINSPVGPDSRASGRDDHGLDAWAAAVLPSPMINSPASPDSRASERDDHGLEIAGLVDLPRAVRTRVLRAWAERQGAGSISAERTAALDALVTDWRGQGPIDLPGGLRVARTSGRLVAYRARPLE